MKLFIGCSSSDEIPVKYLDDCQNYLENLLKDNDLIFGTYNKGIMGIAYDIAKKNKRHITGICPKYYLKDLEVLDLDTKIITDSISERINRLIEESDAIIFLPGGTGTMQELFTALVMKSAQKIDKPIIIYNSNNYFDEALKVLDKIYNEKFTSNEISKYYHISYSIEDTLEYLKKYTFNKTI